ncbi:MAG: hypothetical protein KGL39_16300 [Patescibacteria group bacterium]|nr:hypothetical protein [Patescibacteria group bacterium]
MSFEFVRSLPVATVPLYGVTALEHQATELRRACDLFLLPAEAIGGGKMQTLKRLNEEIGRLSGAEPADDIDNPYAELERKYLHDLAAAAALGNWEMVEYLEGAYAAEARQVRRQHIQEEQERLGQSLDPAIMAALEKHLAKKVKANTDGSPVD